MTAAELNAMDMFPDTFSEPCGAFHAVLSDPGLVEKIAMTRLANAICPHLRGDGKRAGKSVVTYGLPLLFSVKISHPHTRYIEELAGISLPKKTLGVKYTPPCESTIAEAVKVHHAALVARMAAAAALALEDLNL